MLVSLIYTLTCPACGATSEGVMVRQVRINKNSMRTVKGDIGLGFLPRTCKPCGTALPDTAIVDRGRLAPDDLAKVNTYRARKGWPAIGTREPVGSAGTATDPLA